MKISDLLLEKDPFFTLSLDLFAWVDLAGTFLQVNPAFKRFLGFELEELKGKSYAYLVVAEDRPLVEEALSRLDRNRPMRELVVRVEDSWGHLHWMEVNAALCEEALIHMVARDITHHRRLSQEVDRLTFSATHDLLTGLPNRTLLEEHLAKAIIDTPSVTLFGVLFVDLDGFKPINDTLGHRIGDDLLKQVAIRLLRKVGPDNSVARFGADEFVVMLTDCTEAATVQSMAEEILVAIARPYRIQGNELRITASIGVAVNEGLVDSPMVLVQRADMAMYRAKHQGHNTICWYRQELAEKASESVSLRSDLQNAIDTDQLELYYQPQLHGPSGRVTGFEALIRWQHPERGYVSPADFIGLAESTGQIIPTSDWVLETACRDALELNALGMGDFTMAVNISPIQFKRTHFVRDLLNMLENCGLSPALLELELTEGVLMERADWALKTLELLRRQGLKLAIDDFGTGFSSLSYLKHLPVSRVKIDRTFIKDIISDHRDAAIVQGIITMARAMKMEVLAEGVETHAQYAYLSRHQCTLYQGFHFARPMPLARLTEFLVEHHRAQQAKTIQAGGET